MPRRPAPNPRNLISLGTLSVTPDIRHLIAPRLPSRPGLDIVPSPRLAVHRSLEGGPSHAP